MPEEYHLSIRFYRCNAENKSYDSHEEMEKNLLESHDINLDGLETIIVSSRNMFAKNNARQIRLPKGEPFQLSPDEAKRLFPYLRPDQQLEKTQIPRISSFYTDIDYLTIDTNQINKGKLEINVLYADRAKLCHLGLPKIENSHMIISNGENAEYILLGQTASKVIVELSLYAK